MSRGRSWALLVVLALIPGGAAAQTAPSRVTLTEITVEHGGELAEVRLKLSGPVTPKTELMGGPWRLVLDLEGVEYRLKKAPDKTGGDPIREVRASQYRAGVTRVVIELTRRATWAVESTADGLRVMFPMAAPAPGAPPKPASPTPGAKAVPPKAPASPAARPKGTPEVQGIIVRDNEAIAYIRDPATKQVRSYRVGDKVGDAVIEKIGEREVVLTTPTGRVEVRLEERKPTK